MTAPFDATHGTDQRFTDALSGSDGTADPSLTMPVLDVYPDALSAPMPFDLVPVAPPVPMAQPGVRADPVTGPAARPSGRPPAAQRGSQRQAAPRQGAVRPPTMPARPPTMPARPIPLPARPIPLRPAVQAYRPIAPSQPPPQSFGWQGMSMSASDVAAAFRNMRPGQPAQVDRESFQATHPQSSGSGAPAAVAPAAPMASQYSGRGQARNDARERAQERRRTAPTAARKSSAGAVLVFFLVILFASGLGQKLIDLFSELFNR